MVLGYEVPGFGEKKASDALSFPGIFCIHDAMTKNMAAGAGEMAQQLGVLATFPEDQGFDS